ncbi:hypothetical protein BS50DRAFT_584071 [Corynespora cassiicola Philippines]|uniref:Uncharacterized protein n=1 Tax=Corynespora cassiicola Philippines TaxID=1448308 RepID=A0A2T2P5E5_CORCC|nr:hypothetical protein BS50DRAFT_584071 [Corynespora cassiicola Philippines]
MPSDDKESWPALASFNHPQDVKHCLSDLTTWTFADVARSAPQTLNKKSRKSSTTTPKSSDATDETAGISSKNHHPASIESDRQRRQSVLFNSSPVDVGPLNLAHLAPAILNLPTTTFPGLVNSELLDQFKVQPHPNSAVAYSVLTVRRLPYLSHYEIIAETLVYHSPWKVFRFLDMPPELRNNVYDHWISQWEEGVDLRLDIHRHHGVRKQLAPNPCWMPSLCRANVQISQETFPIFLRRANVIAKDAIDLKWLHGILSGFEGPKLSPAVLGVSQKGAYHYLRSLSLPHFFAGLRSPTEHRKLELGLLDRCKFITQLVVGLNTTTLTRPVLQHQGFQLRELRTLNDILDAQGIPHIFLLRHLKHVTLDCVDEEFVYRNCNGEPLSALVSVGLWLHEGFRFRLRDHVMVDMRVREGRFREDGEGLPTDFPPMDEPATISKLPELERAVERHWKFFEDWETWSRIQLTSDITASASSADVAGSNGLDKDNL